MRTPDGAGFPPSVSNVPGGQNVSPALTLIGVLQLLTRWLGIYSIALVGAIFFLAGMFAETTVLILVAEVFLLLQRPRPALGPQTLPPDGKPPSRRCGGPS